MADLETTDEKGEKMTSTIRIRKADGLWVVRAAGAVIGESRNALELAEGDGAPVIYFPRSDIAMAFLEPTNHRSHSPTLGDASYFSVTSTAETLKNAAWSYEAPASDAEAIKDHVAFTDRVAVEQL